MEALEKKHGETVLPVTHADVPARLKQPTWTLITTAGSAFANRCRHPHTTAAHL